METSDAIVILFCLLLVFCVALKIAQWAFSAAFDFITEWFEEARARRSKISAEWWFEQEGDMLSISPYARALLEAVVLDRDEILKVIRAVKKIAADLGKEQTYRAPLGESGYAIMLTGRGGGGRICKVWGNDKWNFTEKA